MSLFGNTCSSTDKILIPTFAVVLQNINIEKLKSLRRDFLVIDYSFDGSGDNEIPQEDIQKLKDSGKKVFAYLSIGEAEDYRFYWREEYNQKKPDWIVRENPEWKGNYTIRYWTPPWKEIVKEYMTRIQKAGFDGLFLDKVDAYDDFKPEDIPHIDPRTEMIILLYHIFRTNQELGANFQFILNNGESIAIEDQLVSDFSFAILVESLYTDGDNQERTLEEYGPREKNLKALDKQKKWILLLEYVTSKDLQTKIKKKAKKNHFSIEYAKQDLSLPEN